MTSNLLYMNELMLSITILNILVFLLLVLFYNNIQ